MPGKSSLNGWFADVIQLGKPRISGMVLISTLIGYFLGYRGGGHWPHLAILIGGTALISWGIHALNQYMERDLDAVMPRTMHRPLPGGRMRPDPVFFWGVVVTTVGLGIFIVGSNLPTSLVALAVVALYLLVYTPLKRITSLNTLVGAVPGALPPVLGWAAATGRLGVEALSLFLIVFIWQLPHFLPIAWLYRHDYRRAGLRMLTVSDTSGASLRRQQVLYTGTLVLVSLNPTLIGMTGPVYFIGALLLGLGFMASSLWLAFRLNDATARMTLKVSVIYLPLLLGLLVYEAFRGAQ